MKTLLTAALAIGLAASVTAPAFADCAGHTASTKTKPVTTADGGTATPRPTTDRQG